MMLKTADIFALVTLSIIAHKSLSEPSCTAYRFAETPGMELPNHVILTMTKSLIVLCWEECVQLPWCFSINVRQLFDVFYECDLNNSTMGAAGGLEPRLGSEYHEMVDVSAAMCEAKDCIIKQILENGWYRIGSRMLKLFKEEKNWTEASEHCKANSGNLTSLSSSFKNGFVYDVLTKPIQANITAPAPSTHYWALDGHDSDISLQVKGNPKQAQYKTYDGELSLYVNLKNSYADIPAFQFNLEGFTLAFKLKIDKFGAQNVGTILTDTISSEKPGFILNYRKQEKRLEFTMSSDDGIFLSLKTKAASPVSRSNCRHIAITWNKTNENAAIAVNGKVMKVKVELDRQSTDFKKSTSNVYRFGIPSDITINRRPFHGFMKQLMVFDRALTIDEINDVMKYNEYGPWIGLSDLTQNKLFGWSDGTHISNYIPLPAYSPDTVADTSSCAAMGRGGKWMNKNCNEKRPFICEKAFY